MRTFRVLAALDGCFLFCPGDIDGDESPQMRRCRAAQGHFQSHRANRDVHGSDHSSNEGHLVRDAQARFRGAPHFSQGFAISLPKYSQLKVRAVRSGL